MANGTIAFDTLSTSGQISGTAISVDADYLAYGSAKSWLSATISSNTHTIQDSFNVGSVTDDGAGRTDLVFTNNMANDDYSATQSAATNASNVFVHLGNNDLVTTSNFRNNTANDGGTIVDYDVLCATVHGDLA